MQMDQYGEFVTDAFLKVVKERGILMGRVPLVHWMRMGALIGECTTRVVGQTGLLRYGNGCFNGRAPMPSGSERAGGVVVQDVTTRCRKRKSRFDMRIENALRGAIRRAVDTVHCSVRCTKG